MGQRVGGSVGQKQQRGILGFRDSPFSCLYGPTHRPTDPPTERQPVSRGLFRGCPRRPSFLSERDRSRPPAAYPQCLDRSGHPSLPIWPCSRWGLPCRSCYQKRGGLLPHLFTLANRSWRSVFCGTVRQPSCLDRPGVTWQRAQWSPDFPRGESFDSPRDYPVGVRHRKIAA